MPELPAYHGQMAIGEPVVFLSMPKLSERALHKGDSIGDFRVLAFNDENISFEWQGHTVERRIEELRAKQASTPQAVGQVSLSAVAPGVASGAPANFVPGTPASASSSSSNSSTPRITTLGAAKNGTSANNQQSASSEASQESESIFGAERSDGNRDCKSSDNTPSGTERSGYRKSSTMLLVGQVCVWEKVK